MRMKLHHSAHIFACLIALTLGAASAHAQSQDVRDSLRCWQDLINEDMSLAEKHRLFDSQHAFALSLAQEGRYADAQAVYDFALSVHHSRNQFRFTLGCDLAKLLMQRGMYAGTYDSLLQIEPLSHGDSRVRWQWIDRMAQVLTLLDSTDRALALYDQLLTTIPDSILWEVRANRGYLLANMGQLAAAIEDIETALSALGDTHEADRAVILSNLAVCYSLSGRHDYALTLIEQALSQQRALTALGEQHPDYIIMLRQRAEILFRAGRKTEAAQAFEAYVESERTYAIAQFPAFSEQQRLDYWANKRPLLSEAFSVGNEAAPFLFDLALFRREVALLGAPDSARMTRRLSVRGKDVQRQLGRKDAGIDFVRYTGLDSVSRYAALVVTPSRIRFVPLWTEDSLNAFSVGDSTTTLPLKEAVCSTRISHKNIIYRDSLLAQRLWQPLLPLLGGVNDIYFAPDGLLHMLAIEQLLPPELEGATLYRLTSLARLVEQPEAARIATTTGLAIGGLDYNASPSGTDMASTAADHSAADYLLQATKSHSFYFPTLPATGEEVARIDSLLPSLTACTSMTEEELRTYLAKAGSSGQDQILHIASHGYSLQVDVPRQHLFSRDEQREDRSLLASGLALTGANNAHLDSLREDGILSARELCDLDLSPFRLVVLSACQSALGEASDEGPAGLVRGLKKAGAGAVIATLWEVSDQSTALFMQHFYDALRRQKHPGDLQAAFAQAQQELRQITRQEPVLVQRFSPAALATRWLPDGDRTEDTNPYNDPYFWAAFILLDANAQ